MPIESIIIKNIGDLIINVLQDEVSNMKTNIIDKFRFRSFKKRIWGSITEFINKNDGTVLTKGRFYEFLEYHHPIEKIYKYISEPHE